MQAAGAAAAGHDSGRHILRSMVRSVTRGAYAELLIAVLAEELTDAQLVELVAAKKRKKDLEERQLDGGGELSANFAGDCHLKDNNLRTASGTQVGAEEHPGETLITGVDHGVSPVTGFVHLFTVGTLPHFSDGLR